MDRLQGLTAGLLAVLMLGAMTTVRAGELPLWEAGIGLAGLDTPDYRGSEQRQQWLLPLPLFIYRGERLRIDREGLRGIFHEDSRLQLTLSLNGSVPAASDGDSARAGMADLDPTLEIGPSLNLTLHRDADWRLRLRLPVRGVLATDLRQVRGIGSVFWPNLAIDTPQRYGAWEYGASIGPLFGSNAWHDYFYRVNPADATPERPACDPGGGYSGTTLMLSLTRRSPRWWFGAFLRYDRLAGVAFADSPLVERDDSLQAGFGLSWMFARSSRSVGRTEVWR
ncbi:MAG: MipA/OmpV family protein [Gammaproteobacteria bacterium]|nr:MAG: MipA/OmpV family protein [Gammaproteobacteria bacterium]